MTLSIWYVACQLLMGNYPGTPSCVRSLQIVLKSGTRRWNLRVPFFKWHTRTTIVATERLAGWHALLTKHVQMNGERTAQKEKLGDAKVDTKRQVTIVSKYLLYGWFCYITRAVIKTTSLRLHFVSQVYELRGHHCTLKQTVVVKRVPQWQLIRSTTESNKFVFWSMILIRKPSLQLIKHLDYFMLW